MKKNVKKRIYNTMYIIKNLIIYSNTRLYIFNLGFINYRPRNGNAIT